MVKHYLFLTLFIFLNNIYSQDIYLVIDQSNTAGRGVIGTEDEGTLSNVYLLNDDGDWENAENPTNRYSTIRKDITQQGVNYAYTFGQRLHELTGNDIGLVVNARGGTNINYRTNVVFQKHLIIMPFNSYDFMLCKCSTKSCTQ